MSPAPPPWSIAVSTNDRTRPLRDGRASLGGHSRWTFVDGPIEDLFARAFADAPFELTEISFSNHLISVANGTARYVGLPIFTSRSFRHSAIYVRTGSGITVPADLAGRRVGLREYTNTASLVARGMLADEFGVSPQTISWYVGDIDPPLRTHIPRPDIGGATSITPVVGRDLGSMLECGELDALIAYHPPAAFRPGGPVQRLFPDFRAAEQEYATRTGIFPIMHLMAVRKDFLDSIDPAILVDVARGFADAKALSYAELADQQALKVMLPWAAAELEQTRTILGEDFWAYGLEPNRAVLTTQIRYSSEQGLLAHDVGLDEVIWNHPEIETTLTAR